MNRKDAIKLAKKYASDFTIKHAGVTKDHCVVTTLECVEYQKRKKNLIVHFDGNWKFKNSEWVKGRTITINIK